MSPTFQSLGIDRLSVPERIALVQEIWDSIAREAESTPLTEAQRQECRRLERPPGESRARQSWNRLRPRRWLGCADEPADSPAAGGESRVRRGGRLV